MAKKESFIIWNGVSSETFGLHVEHYPNLNRPPRKYTAADVPGKNGTAYILQDAWSETVQAYEISIKKPVPNFKEIAEWLNSADGYAMLQDSYDPWIYRMAVMVDGFDATNTLQRAGKALIQFRCRPERYLIDQTIEITGSQALYNPTNHPAMPLLKIHGQGFPSMLPTTERTNVSNTYNYSYTIEGLTPAKVRYNFIGLTLPYTEETGSWNINQDPAKINTHSETEGDISITATEGGYGIGMNRSVNPLTTYTLSFKHGLGNLRTNKLAIVLTDKNGWIVQNAGIHDLAPFDTRRSFTFKTIADSYWAVFIFIPTGGITSPCIIEDIQLNLGSERLPYVPYSGSTACSVDINDVRINLAELGDYIYFDCETMNAYRGEKENLNPLVSLTDPAGNMTMELPQLAPGENFIEVTSGDWITKIEVTPRYWTL